MITRMLRTLTAVPIAIALFAGAWALPASPASPTLDRIKETRTITFSYRNGAVPFSYRDRDGHIRGYSVELCTRIAGAVQKQLGLSELKIEWKPTEAENRLENVATGRVDIDCGTTTITLARMEAVDFSLPIFVDGGGILVAAGTKPMKIADLGGKRIAVIPGTTTEQALRAAFNGNGKSAVLVPVQNGTAGVTLLSDGKVDGYAGDRVVLANLRLRARNPASLAFALGDISYEPYGLALRRDDPDFKLAVNRTLASLYRSGDIDAIFQRWLGPMGKPGTLLNAMYYLNALPE
jgi:glutamate/aspartate transport system substrate-binding protein